MNTHKDIKTQLETITKEQISTTHHKTAYTLIDSASDSSYVSDELLVHRSMGEMLSTTQQDRTVSSGDTHHQVSGESTTIVADGSVSLTNNKQDIRLSAHTAKLEATAKQDINIASSTKEVEIIASNKITLSAGGATITLEGGDITVAATQFTEKSGKHSTAGGRFDGNYLSRLPYESVLTEALTEKFFDEQIQLIDPMGNSLPNLDYLLTSKNINIKAKSDDEGKTPRVDSGDKEDEISIKVDLKHEGK